MDFKIYFKEPTVLTVNDKPITFFAGKTYGFKDIPAKDVKAIKKQVLKSTTMTFTETSNFVGCYKVITNTKEVKDKVVDNLIAMNKGKKSKNKFDFKVKPKVEEVETPEVTETKEEVAEETTIEEVKEEEITNE